MGISGRGRNCDRTIDRVRENLALVRSQSLPRAHLLLARRKGRP